MAAAAYNLGVILGDKHLDEAIHWCRKAHELLPGTTKYSATLAFYLWKNGNLDEAIAILRETIRRDPNYFDAYSTLGEIYESRHDFAAAAAVYRDALKIGDLPPAIRRQVEAKVRAAESQGR